MAGIGAGIQGFASLVTNLVSAAQKNDLSKKQYAKGQQLESQANAVVAENPLNDPAFQMKQFLAQAGIPGFEQYKEGYNQDEANAVAHAEKDTNSSGALLNFLAASEGQKNKAVTSLNTQNAAYIEGKKVDLANQYETEKMNFDQIARDEKAKLNYAATTYENAALEEKQASQDQTLGALGKGASDLGSLLGTIKKPVESPTFDTGTTSGESGLALNAILGSILGGVH
jgi:hypothetical protein